jgi:hypothetical protein
MSNKLHKLRIAFSVVCGIVCLLLCVLWLRSYDTWDRCFRTGKNHGWQLNSMLGHVVLVVAEPPERFIPFFVASLPIEGRFEGEFNKYVLGFYFGRAPGLELGVPFWFLVLISASITAAPWLRHLSWQFSLRTLVIAMTLVALFLGAAVYAIR